MHQYIIPSKKNEENEVKALMELIKEEVAEVTITEERNVHEHEEECNIGTLLWR